MPEPLFEQTPRQFLLGAAVHAQTRRDMGVPPGAVLGVLIHACLNAARWAGGGAAWSDQLRKAARGAAHARSAGADLRETLDALLTVCMEIGRSPAGVPTST